MLRSLVMLRRIMKLIWFSLLVAVLMLGSVPASGASESRAALAAHARLDDALVRKGMSFGSSVYVRIFKEEAELEVWLQNGARYELLKAYPICALSGTLGPKLKEGDAQSPEGFYSVTRAQLNPQSHYHLAFDIGYPNAYDHSLGRTGSLIMVHGNCVSIGCFAMTDEGIEEIYSLAGAALAKGQTSIPVHVFPFRMTEEETRRHADSTWAGFWSDLKTGYDAFEARRVPPEMGLQGGHYFVRTTKP
jgi:murein L,D-transpeptidase YafK